MNCVIRISVSLSLHEREQVLAAEYADCNRAVVNQRLRGSNAWWKWTTDYNQHSIAETATYKIKQLFGGLQTLSAYDGQLAEALAMALTP